jgi:hypothetical protein
LFFSLYYRPPRRYCRPSSNHGTQSTVSLSTVIQMDFHHYINYGRRTAPDHPVEEPRKDSGAGAKDSRGDGDRRENQHVVSPSGDVDQHKGSKHGGTLAGPLSLPLETIPNSSRRQSKAAVDADKVQLSEQPPRKTEASTQPTSADTPSKADTVQQISASTIKKRPVIASGGGSTHQQSKKKRHLGTWNDANHHDKPSQAQVLHHPSKVSLSNLC